MRRAKYGIEKLPVGPELVPELKRNFYQRKNKVRGQVEYTKQTEELLRKLSHLNNFDHGFLQHSPTLKFKHLCYFMFKQRKDFEGFDAHSEIVDIDKINRFLKDRELWKLRMSQHAREYQIILNCIEKSRYQSKRLKSNVGSQEKVNKKRKKQFEFLQELLVKKEFLIDLEKTYQKTLVKFENFLLKYLKRIYYGSPISEDFANLYKKFNEKLTQAQDYLHLINTYIKEQIPILKKKPF